MLFSIIVPVYNVEKYLIECLESLVNQTKQDFEIILIDDGSTDSSGQICDFYAKKSNNTISVIHKNNQGPLAARLDGIKIAHGDYSIFVDSDDFVQPNLIEILTNTVIKDPSLDLVLYSFRYYRNNEFSERFKPIAENLKIWSDNEKHELYEKLLFTNDISAIWTKAVRTSLLKEDATNYTIYFGKNMAEDVLQSLYILTAAHKTIFIDQLLYNYRVLGKSFSHTFTLKAFEKKNTLHVYEKKLEYLKIWDMDTEEYKNRLACSCFEYAIYEFVNCYSAARTNKEKHEIVNTNWSTMIPDLNKVNILEYVNPTHVYLYEKIENKEYFAIKLFFIVTLLKSSDLILALDEKF